MCDMRRLANLFVCFEEECRKNGTDNAEVKDMVQRSNFPQLEVAIHNYTTSESGIKASLNVSMYYLLKKMAKVVKSSLLVSQNDAAAAEIDRFVDVLTLNYNFLFGDAIYHVKQNRQVKLRKPEQLPTNEDVQRVKQYNVNRMAELLHDEYLSWTATEFIELRDLADCRLTLFNARRGGEPARLTLSNWIDARNGVWLSHDRLIEMADVDKQLFSDMKVMYQSGKGNHLVPVLVPADQLMHWKNCVIHRLVRTVVYYQVTATYFPVLRTRLNTFMDGMLFTKSVWLLVFRIHLFSLPQKCDIESVRYMPV